MILINVPDIEDLDFEKAYDNWINLKARRMQNVVNSQDNK
ncbi:14934_t:CDS:2 [Rhizophagus irregularis]|nr:14934_t:CDS:2 [Rhizophagus irregularis]